MTYDRSSGRIKRATGGTGPAVLPGSSPVVKMAKNSEGSGRPLPIKVLSGQLRDGTSKGLNESMECSVRVANGRLISVSMVWMQGTVLEAKLDRNMVLLLDETGTFVVQGVNNIPKGKPCLSQGK